MTLKPENAEVGRQYWSESGESYELLAITNDARFVVARYVEFESEHGWESERSELKIVDAILPNPPRARMDRECRELGEQVEKLRQEYNALTCKAGRAEKEVEQRLRALSKFKGIERIEEFLNGRMSHAVVVTHGGYLVREIKDLQEREDFGFNKGRNNGVKLITLFGKSNGDLEWEVNQYRDGSGTSTEIVPCCGTEQAEAIRRKLIERDFEHKNTYWRFIAVGQALANDIPVPHALLEAYQKAQAEKHEKKRAELQRQINNHRVALDALEEKQKASAA